MTYEEYLVARHSGHGALPWALDRAAQQKAISDELLASRRLDQWLGEAAGGISVVTTHADAIAAVNRLKASGGVIGIDIETAKGIGFDDHPQAGLHPKASRIRLVQLFLDKTMGVIIIDCFQAGYAWIHALVGGHYVAHNAQFECSHLWLHFAQELTIECTMLAGRVFDNDNHKLSDYADEHLELTLSKTLQTSDWGRPELLAEQWLYAAADAVVAKRLWSKFEGFFADNEAKYRNAYVLLRALIYPVVRQAGIWFDLEGHAKVVAQWQHEEQAALQILGKLGLLNPCSVVQKQAWLAAQLTDDELAEWPRTANGKLSTAADTLERALYLPGAEPLARWSQVSTRLANFGTGLAAKLIGGCLYPNYRIGGMVTGRFGCNNPNIQNQPRNGFKHLYLAPEGCQFITGDLSQIELRVAGLVSGDDVINDAYAAGRDLHREVAAERAGKAPDSITKAERQAAKAINFGLIFGAGAARLQAQAISSYGVDMSMADAYEAKAFFHAKYPRLSEWQREIVAQTNTRGYSESPYIKLTRHYDKDVYTHAMNFPVQSGAWEVLALAIIYIDQHLPKDDSIQISHHVYDELCLIARDDNVLEAALLLRDGFLHGFQTVFPEGATCGLVEIGAGRTWEAAGLEENRISEASL